MAGSAGEIMDEETGETNVKAETMNVAAHFRFMDQFFGFEGSFGPSHVTYIIQKKLKKSSYDKTASANCHEFV